MTDHVVDPVYRRRWSRDGCHRKELADASMIGRYRIESASMGHTQLPRIGRRPDRAVGRQGSWRFRGDAPRNCVRRLRGNVLPRGERRLGYERAYIGWSAATARRNWSLGLLDVSRRRVRWAGSATADSTCGPGRASRLVMAAAGTRGLPRPRPWAMWSAFSRGTRGKDFALRGTDCGTVMPPGLVRSRGAGAVSSRLCPGFRFAARRRRRQAGQMRAAKTDAGSAIRKCDIIAIQEAGRVSWHRTRGALAFTPPGQGLPALAAGLA